MLIEFNIVCIYIMSNYNNETRFYVSQQNWFLTNVYNVGNVNYLFFIIIDSYVLIWYNSKFCIESMNINNWIKWINTKCHHKNKNIKNLSRLSVFFEGKGWQNITGELSFLFNILCCVISVHNNRADVKYYLFTIYVCFSYYI
jgi:N-acetylmuramoyl-L-alanine amidase CwlA